MSSRESALLLIDAVANLVLGALLLCYPIGLAELLGLPAADSSFYPTILGGVIFGIGIALLLAHTNRDGLGIDGAIAINFFGAWVLVIWLVVYPPAIPVRGLITLWIVAAVVLGICAVELVQRTRAKRE